MAGPLLTPAETYRAVADFLAAAPAVDRRALGGLAGLAGLAGRSTRRDRRRGSAGQEGRGVVFRDQGNAAALPPGYENASAVPTAGANPGGIDFPGGGWSPQCASTLDAFPNLLLESNYIVRVGTFSESSGILEVQGTGTRDLRAVLQDMFCTNWADGSVTVRQTISTGEPQATGMIRAAWNGADMSGYLWDWVPGGGGTYRILRIDAGIRAVLATAIGEPPPGPDDLITLAASGAGLTLRVNGGDVVNASDATYASGSAALGFYNPAEASIVTLWQAQHD